MPPQGSLPVVTKLRHRLSSVRTIRIWQRATCVLEQRGMVHDWVVSGWPWSSELGGSRVGPRHVTQCQQTHDNSSGCFTWCHTYSMQS
ncbi:hypothetical protein RRG08_037443 [Elysia crispata]|uniref:Uncharacterized protein n=1 Tax=Elysia crispata TaxID=231223 RepID=A0AAE1CSW2_9GAST|nr:hypothetical protein RRG08_037443 [Elysia crispata]